MIPAQLGEVKNVIDRLDEGVPARLYRRQECLLVAVQRCVGEQFSSCQNTCGKSRLAKWHIVYRVKSLTMQRRPQFVRDVRNKVALGFVRQNHSSLKNSGQYDHADGPQELQFVALEVLFGLVAGIGTEESEGVLVDIEDRDDCTAIGFSFNLFSETTNSLMAH